MGDLSITFAKALKFLDREEGIRVESSSSIYRTEPQGDTTQPWFHNQVSRLHCEPFITPENLLALMLNTEKILGRKRDPSRRFGPRAIDLDLLLFDSISRSTKDLTLPHPRMCERAFVLVPLRELSPGFCFPDGAAIHDVLAALDYSVEGDAIYQPARTYCFPC